jgi:hypothetical protein
MPVRCLGDLPQDLGFKGDASFVKIGDGCMLREGVTIHRGTKPGTTTVIGNRCMFMANSHAAHNVQTGDDVILANGALLGGYARVGHACLSAAMRWCTSLCKIGDVAMLGGGSPYPRMFLLIARYARKARIASRAECRRFAPGRNWCCGTRRDQESLQNDLPWRHGG